MSPKEPLESHKDYRELLSEILNERKKKNSKYSLRALARDVGLSPSRCSEVIAKKGHLTKSSFEKLLKKVALTPTQSRFWLQLHGLSRESDPKLRQEMLVAIKKLDSLQEFPDEKFPWTAPRFDWVILTIAELFKCSPTRSWASAELQKRLQISKAILEDSLQILCDLKVIAKDASGLFHLQSDFFRSILPGTISISLLRAFHLSIMEQAAKALSEQAPENRHITSLVYAIPKTLVPEFKKRIDEVSREMSERARALSEGQPDSVYAFAVQFFRLDR